MRAFRPDRDIRADFTAQVPSSRYHYTSGSSSTKEKYAGPKGLSFVQRYAALKRRTTKNWFLRQPLRQARQSLHQVVVDYDDEDQHDEDEGGLVDPLFDAQADIATHQ